MKNVYTHAVSNAKFARDHQISYALLYINRILNRMTCVFKESICQTPRNSAPESYLPQTKSNHLIIHHHHSTTKTSKRISFNGK